MRFYSSWSHRSFWSSIKDERFVESTGVKQKILWVDNAQNLVVGFKCADLLSVNERTLKLVHEIHLPDSKVESGIRRIDGYT